MTDPVFVQFPPSLSLFKTSSPLVGGTYLPISATEDNELDLTNAFVGLMICGFALVLLFARSHHNWFDLFFLSGFGLLGFIYAWRSMRKIMRARRHGPNRVTVSPEGISVSAAFTGVLRWTDVASVIVQQYQDKIYSATIRLNDPAAFADRRLEERLRDDPFVKIDLSSFRAAQELGQAMVGAANKFSGKHIGGMDLPLFSRNA